MPLYDRGHASGSRRKNIIRNRLFIRESCKYTLNLFIVDLSVDKLFYIDEKSSFGILDESLELF